MFQEISKAVLTGFILAVLMTAPLVQVHAQFGAMHIMSDSSVPAVTSAANSTKMLAQQIKDSVTHLTNLNTNKLGWAKTITEYSIQAQRWAVTAQQYLDEIFQMARQFTSLKGVLGLAMQQAGVGADVLKSFKEWAGALYGVIQVKKQYESLWFSRMRLFRGWWVRAKNGIFDPNQDWLDLQNYFLNSMGRRSYEAALDMERMRQLDMFFQRTAQEIDKLRDEEARIQKQLTTINDQIEKEQGLSPQFRVTTINDQTGAGTIDKTNTQVTISTERIALLTQAKIQLEDSLRDVQSKIQNLINQLNDRYQYYYLIYGKSNEEAEKIFNSTKGWENVNGIRYGELRNILDLNENAGQNIPPTSSQTP